MIISRGKYKDEPCHILESDILRVIVLPQRGGKVQSIFYKPLSRDILFQSPGDAYRKSRYADPWAEGEKSGFDEMFPTIAQCFYPSYPWAGAHLPCHGEVWALPWQAEETTSGLSLAVHGVRLPYGLSKIISLSNGGRVLRQEYSAVNHSAFDMDVLWAAHPLFEINESVRIELPPDTTEIINVYDGSKILGAFGSVHSWPVAELTRVGPASNRKAEKFYTYNRVQNGYCALLDKKYGTKIQISYPADILPYLGVWINESGFDDQYNAALEPCTSAFDRLDATVDWNRRCVIKAFSTLKWFLEIKVSDL